MSIQRTRQHKTRPHRTKLPKANENKPVRVNTHRIQRALENPTPQTLLPDVVRSLQRTRGNQFVMRLLQKTSSTVQRKPEPAVVIKDTWLRKKSPKKNSLLHGTRTNEKLQAGDEVEVDEEKRFSSRLGGDVEQEGDRAKSREAFTPWYQAVDLQNDAEGYLREGTFAFMERGQNQEDNPQAVQIAGALALMFHRKTADLVGFVRSICSELKSDAGSLAPPSEDLSPELREQLDTLDTWAPGTMGSHIITASFQKSRGARNIMESVAELENPSAIKKKYGEARAIVEDMLDNFGQAVQLAARIQQFAEEIARAARAAGESEFARVTIGTADKIDQRLKREGNALGLGIEDQEEAPKHLSDTIGMGTTVLSALNDLGLGLGGTIAGLAGSKVASGATFGATAGGIGIFFGLIAMYLGYRAAWRSNTKEDKLKALLPTLKKYHGGKSDIVQVTKYAKRQKRTKKKRSLLSGTGGALAVSAGILSILAAANIVGAGIAAGFGLAAAIVGLGFLVWKGINKFRKWRAKRNESRKLADVLIAQANQKEDLEAQTEAKAKIKEFTGSSATPRDKRSRKQLANAIKATLQSKRQEAAESIVSLLQRGTPSQRFDTEAVVMALGLKPDKLQKISYEKAVGEVARKLQSW